MKAKLGIAPIAWWNDDLAELSDDVSLEECLRQASEAGFTGMETGRRFPMDAAVLGPILAQLRHQRLRRLVLGPAARRRHRGREGPHRRADGLLQGRRRALHRLRRDRALDPGRPLEAARDQAEALRGRDRRLRPQDDRLRRMVRRARACRSPTTTTWRRSIETEPELDLFMKHSGEGIPLLYDAGHMAFAGGDVLRVIDKHHARISPRPHQGRADGGDRRARPRAGELPRRGGEGRLHRARRRQPRLRGDREAARRPRLRGLVRRRGRAGPEGLAAARDGEDRAQGTAARHGRGRLRAWRRDR